MWIYKGVDQISSTESRSKALREGYLCNFRPVAALADVVVTLSRSAIGVPGMIAWRFDLFATAFYERSGRTEPAAAPARRVDTDADAATLLRNGNPVTSVQKPAQWPYQSGRSAAQCSQGDARCVRLDTSSAARK
jgi:hypothetical protein